MDEITISGSREIIVGGYDAFEGMYSPKTPGAGQQRAAARLRAKLAANATFYCDIVEAPASRQVTRRASLKAWKNRARRRTKA